VGQQVIVTIRLSMRLNLLRILFLRSLPGYVILRRGLNVRFSNDKIGMQLFYCSRTLSGSLFAKIQGKSHSTTYVIYILDTWRTYTALRYEEWHKVFRIAAINNHSMLHGINSIRL
jgi:hypothetical protein